MPVTITMTFARDRGSVSDEQVIATCALESDDDFLGFEDAEDLKALVSCALAACCQAIDDQSTPQPATPPKGTGSIAAPNGTACKRRW